MPVYTRGREGKATNFGGADCKGRLFFPIPPSKAFSSLYVGTSVVVRKGRSKSRKVRPREISFSSPCLSLTYTLFIRFFTLQLELPPLREEALVDRPPSQADARARAESLRTEAHELELQIRQLTDALETLVRIQTRLIYGLRRRVISLLSSLPSLILGASSLSFSTRPTSFRKISA